MTSERDSERRGREATISELDVDPGLCARCVHLRLLRSRSTFVRCSRSAVDPRFPRYPQLPVLRCAGFEERADSSESRPGDVTK